MIYEVRTYTFKPGFVGKWEASFCEVFASGSTPPELGALWHTDIGSLNEAVQIWMYDDLEHRAEVGAKIEKEAGWPPNGNDAILEQDSQIFTPAPFSPKLGGGQKLDAWPPNIGPYLLGQKNKILIPAACSPMA